MIFVVRELLQDFPALPSLQCVVSAISLSSTPHSDDPLTQNATTEGPQAEGAPTSTKPTVRSVITPPENTTWSSAQLAPFVQRLAPGQPVEGTVVPCFLGLLVSWSAFEFSSGYYLQCSLLHHSSLWSHILHASPLRFYLRNEQALILLRRERFQFELRLHYTLLLFLHYRRVKSSCWFRRNVQAPSGHFRSFRGESLCFKLVNCKEECLQYSVPRSWRTRTRTRPLWRSCSLWRSARLLVYKTEALSGV